MKNNKNQHNQFCKELLKSIPLFSRNATFKVGMLIFDDWVDNMTIYDISLYNKSYVIFYSLPL
jgi:hypothetical protein